MPKPNRRLSSESGSTPVRSLDDADFVAIVSAGLSDTVNPRNAKRYGLDPTAPELEAFAPRLTVEETSRSMERALSSRIVRNASFRRTVCCAYDDRCAVTRLKIINGGGRAEVQAAHIVPVEDGGPDVVQNGLALSATVHWLFDRHLISLDDDYRILIAHNRIPAELRALFASQNERIHLPANHEAWPHPRYLAKHREAFSGG